MKIFKKIATMIMALTLCFGFVGVAASCGGGSGAGSSSEQPADVYVFTVVDQNGAPVENVIVQLCIPGGSCLMAMPKTDANGKANFTAPEAAVYDIHVWSADMATEYTLTGTTQTPASYGAVSVTIAK